MTILMATEVTTKRPEAMRVINEDGKFFVQTFNANMERWITQKAYNSESEAMLDCVNWY